MEHFNFLFDTDTALFIVFAFGVVIGWLIIGLMNGMDAIFRLVEEFRLISKIKKLEKLEKEVNKDDRKM